MTPKKRFFDLLIASIAFLLLAWIFIPCMVILLCTGEHYIWFSQKRIGYKNQYFHIFKFATMLYNSPNMENGSITIRNDPRILPFGKFLRKTKINELPQIFNVFNGTMSIIGPRPQVEADFYRFPKHVQEHIYDSVPGITGLGSLIFRDEERYLSRPGVDPVQFYTDYIAPYKGELELWYLSHRWFWVDVKIVLLTAWVILYPKSTLPFRFFEGMPPRPDWMKKMDEEDDIEGTPSC